MAETVELTPPPSIIETDGRSAPYKAGGPIGTRARYRRQTSSEQQQDDSAVLLELRQLSARIARIETKLDAALSVLKPQMHTVRYYRNHMDNMQFE